MGATQIFESCCAGKRHVTQKELEKRRSGEVALSPSRRCAFRSPLSGASVQIWEATAKHFPDLILDLIRIARATD